MTTIGYVRISCDKDKGVSIERQWAMIQGYCSLHGLGDPLCVSDVDYSGASSSRPGWQRLLAEVARGSTVVAFDQDRLFRDEEEAAKFLKLVRKRAVAVHLVTTGVLDLANADVATMFSFKAVLDAHVSRKTSEKMRAWAAHRQRQGRKAGGTVPYGYDADATGRLSPNHSEQAVIRLMLDLRAAGYSYKSIANRLTADRVRTKTGLGMWWQKTVAAIVKANCGKGLKVSTGG